MYFSVLNCLLCPIRAHRSRCGGHRSADMLSFIIYFGLKTMSEWRCLLAIEDVISHHVNGHTATAYGAILDYAAL